MLSSGAVTRHGDFDEGARTVDADATDMRDPASVRDIAVCDSVATLRMWLDRFARSNAYDAGCYIHLGHNCIAVSGSARPLRWLSTRAEAAGCRAIVDAAIAPVAGGFLPFVWSARDKTNPEQRAGITIPVQDHAAGPACVVLFGDDVDASHALIEKQTPSLIVAALALHLRAKAVIPRANPAGEALSDREIECLRLAALGATLSGIAGTLGISVRTIEIHVGRAARKLSAANKVHAVALAIGAGLITV